MLTLLLLAQAPALPDVLRALGDAAEAREAAGGCAYQEVTRVEELGEDGAVKGSEERTYDDETKGVEVTKRDRTRVKPSGEPLADLLQEPKGAKGRKPARSPFHSAMRSQFRFELKAGPRDGLVTVTLEPLKPDPERPRGEAWVRLADLKLETLKVSPSKPPMLLDALSIEMQFGQTACGWVPTVILSEGRGQAPLLDTRFRTRTVLSGHQKL
jgi:hypothetical protein